MEILSSINIVDVVVVLLLIYFSYRGYISGFFNILFDSLAVIVSFYVANQYSLVLKGWMADYLKFTVSWSGFAAYILVYMLSFVFFVVWGRIVTKILKISPMGIANSIAGLVLNFFKWSLLIFILIVIIDKITIDSVGAYLDKSFVYKSFNKVSNWEFVKEFIPDLTP
ncbi:MAG: CvpA family protein [Candidatus Margulisbacteria bacterium]|nr:CvpA family protein [Candidatus Margulisiibacteriota bacterium]